MTMPDAAVQAIRERHAAQVAFLAEYPEILRHEVSAAHEEAHADRATLLRAYEAVVGQMEYVRKRVSYILCPGHRDGVYVECVACTNATLRAQHAALVDLLRRMEWSPTMGVGEPTCPACGNTQYGGEGHKAACLLRATLDAAKEP